MGKQYNEVAKTVLAGLEKYKGSYFTRDNYDEFESRMRKLQHSLIEARNDKRLLKIGIVGAVKAGKSSFLNALIFNGEERLPKATTPMTAALTRISYSTTPSASIVFYTQDDWGIIKKYASEYDKDLEKGYQVYKKNFDEQQKSRMRRFGQTITGDFPKPCKKEEWEAQQFRKEVSEQVASCKELVQMYEKHSGELNDLLGTTKELSLDTMHGVLQDYVGTDGKYTPIVSYVELRLNIDDLKGVEIVDTPGLDDPIVSRGLKTKDFMGDCDVVFMLSNASQFLTEQDIAFVRGTLPSEGVDDIIVVCSKFDSGLMDYNKSQDILKAIAATKESCASQAERNIGQCRADNNVLDKLKASLPPSYVSSLMYSCAKKKKEGINYNKEEAHVVGRLKKQFANFSGDYAQLHELSGIDAMKLEKLQPIMKKKQEIIDKRNASMLSKAKENLLNNLKSIANEVSVKREDLKHSDKAELEKKYSKIESTILGVRSNIRNIFDSYAIDAKAFLNRMKPQIESKIYSHNDVAIKTVSHEESKTRTTGMLWWKKTTVSTYQVVEHSASVIDVIDNLRQYLIACKISLNDEFQALVNVNKLEKDIKEEVIKAFDAEDLQEGFKEGDILIPLKNAVKEIQIPNIDIDIKKYETNVTSRFSKGVAKGDEIHDLKMLQQVELGNVAEALKCAIDDCGRNVAATMSAQANGFVDKVVLILKENLESLKKLLADKEKSISECNALCEELLPEYKKLVEEMLADDE